MGNRAEQLAEQERKIIIAENWLEQPQQHDMDVNYKAFMQVMEYRKKVAIQYRNTHSEDDKRLVLDVFNNCNERISKILGL